ncbi:Protocadherin alpha-2 [Camelus dromedarius]|uniref:Protocadherin alpha-2 n=1 Tax=Camelus dromedarius TaxID=9838 RepID=A0A5N4EB60_CAMDR|nr:Protocadherin alpha-2 [Camelus dromedarius]
MLASGPGGAGARPLLLSFLLLATWEAGSGQVHYSVSEEAKHGTFVGRIAQDLGLELAELVPRLFRVASKGRGDLLEVNLQNGILFVNSRIDREELCGRSTECSIHLEVIVDRPLQVFHVEVEVKDINDNPPVFPATHKNLFISESRALDSHFSLEGASDADIGTNALLTYRLSPNEYFSLDTPTNDEQIKPLELVLKKPLDREAASELLLVLKATDGGKPELTVICSLAPEVPFKLVSTFKNYYSLVLDSALDRESVANYELVVTARDGGSPSLSATASVSVDVSDVNDNAPTFAQPEYTVFVKENNPPGCHIFTVSARDADAQENALVSYSLVERRVGERALSSYVSVHAESGKVYALQPLDHEELELLQFQVSARDAGVPPLGSNVTLQVFVLDENDNAPALLPPGPGGRGRRGEPAGGASWARATWWRRCARWTRTRATTRGCRTSWQARGAARSPFRVGLYTARCTRRAALDEADAHPAPAGAGEGPRRAALTATATRPGAQASSRASTGRRWSGAALVDVNVYLIPVCAHAAAVHGAAVLAPSSERARGVLQRGGELVLLAARPAIRVCSGEGPPKSDLIAFSPSVPPGTVRLLLSLLLLAAWEAGSGQVYYSVSEEAKHGTFVGRIAQDLGLELAELVPRLFRVASKGRGDLLEVNLQNGILFVNSRIDREELCGRSTECSIHLEVIVDRPLQVTVIALISVSDRDSGANGQVICSLTPQVPFKIISTFKNYYSLVLDSVLDRESVANYKLVVTARDGGSPSLSATASVSVDVADVNDNAPTFAQPEYTVFVKENNPPGCHIFTVSARDADAQENALVSYSLVERRVGERALGKVYALQPLDHEELELLQFQVSARDAGVPPLGSNNDKRPRCCHPGPGGVAGAVSQLVARSVGRGPRWWRGERGGRGLGLQRAAAGAARSPFRVGLYTGEISTTRALDEADAPRQRLLVLVKDHGEPALTATATVLLSLEDSGQAPKASSRASTGAAGAEAALVDVNVYLIVAICAVSSLFVLTLLLYTALRCSAPPSEGACGPGKPRLVCSSAVGSWSYSQQRRQRQILWPLVHVFLPVWTEKSERKGRTQNQTTLASGQVHYSVPEEAKHGTFVGRIAQDLGLELEELVPRLFRVASKGPGDLLEVNLQNGILFVNSRIDREELIHLEVIVDRPLQVFHVEVEVKDINDNPPDAQVGTVIALISVSDPDSGTNGQVTCSLTPQVPFKLVSTFKNYYSLVLDNTLDRESVANYELVVTARDGGSPSLSATASVSVDVADVNDNAPTFAQPEYTVFVKENNPPGCHIFTVSAWDADAQENALVSYSLVERRVGASERCRATCLCTGERQGVRCSRWTTRSWSCCIPGERARRGRAASGSNVTLQVFVLDENDKAPACCPAGSPASGRLVASWWRGRGRGHVVAKVRAVDADSGYNAWLSYELQAAAGAARSPFRVGLYTGEISTTRALDEADAPRQRLLVLVKDHGEPALTATATVLLSLEDSGQAPKASSRASTGAAGAEAALVDVNVYLIVAICAVSSLFVLTLLLYTALRCSAPPSEGACGPGKPRLVCSSAVGSWSYSQQRRQRVCSAEGPPKTDLIAFRAPRLLLSLLLLAVWEAGSGQVHYSVPEEAKHGTFVGRIAQDLGLELAELVPRLFRVASKGRGDLLEVNLQNGILFVNSRIDREELCGRNAECSIHLEVIVDRPLQVFHVEVEVGTVIALISVSDPDSGTNGQVSCSLTPQVPFKLVSTFKNYYSLVLDNTLDRESVANYELVVTARDGGSPSLSATASVSVDVADVNDNAPTFAQPEYTVFVKENNPPGCHIFTVSARDADAQENALVSYSLVERRVGERALSSYVSVHAESGKVYALQPLDHEELELLQFQVSARDAGVPPLGSNVTLQVFVLDENDNAPALLPPPPGPGGGAGVVSQLVALVRAVDADSGYNAWLSYELQAAAGAARSPFRVGLYTGEISTTRALDEADAPRQRLLVLVKDHGEPALTATATVLLSLEDSGQAPKASSRASTGAAGAEAALVDVNVYLIVAICAVSSLFVLTLLLYTALRARAGPGSPGWCAPARWGAGLTRSRGGRGCALGKDRPRRTS